MSQFNTRLSDFSGRLLDRFGQTVTLTPAGGSGVTGSAIIEEQGRRPVERADGEAVVSMISVKLPEATFAKPERGAVLNDGTNADWGFVEIVGHSGGFWMATFERVEVLTKARPGMNSRRQA